MQEETFEWVVRLYATNWRKTVLLVTFIVLVCGIVYYAFQSLIFVVLAALFLAGSLIKFFIPIRYIFDKEGVRIITPLTQQFRQWSAFKSFYPDKRGVLLSPFPNKSWLENFRGLYLIWGADNHSRILDIIKDNISTK